MTRSGAASGHFTLDTNILVYSVDANEGMRHRSALEVVDRAAEVGCSLALQSISEFYWVVTWRRIMPAETAATLARPWLSLFSCMAPSADAVRTALADAVTERASYWDALMIATAAEAGCALILTEGLADGTGLSGVEIHNPFTRSRGLAARARRLLGL